MPLDRAVEARAHDPMHVQHKYWSRKPVNVVRAHIEACTVPGEVVLDPFCGSGTTVSQSVMTGRKCIAFDVNPMATFITRNTITRVDVGEILVTHERIKDAVANRIHDLYTTRCPTCLETDATTTICLHWKVHHPVKVHFTCHRCDPGRGTANRPLKAFQKVPDAEDLVLLEVIEQTPVPAWYPAAEIPRGIVFDQARRGVSRFADLFTKRNLIALSLIRDEISRVDPGPVQESLQFAFTSMVHLCSRMTPVRPSRPLSSFWATNSYWLPRLFMESNAWLKYDSAITGPQGLLASKRDAGVKVPESTMMTASIDDFHAAPAPCAFITRASALDLSTYLAPASVDYIFTDPPYAGSIPYMELSTLWALWLGMDDQLDYQHEILVDDAREKPLSSYLASMEAFFQQAFLVLKPGRTLTFTYHNLDDRVRRGLLVAAIQAGFLLDSIVYQPPPRTSPAHTLRPFNSAIGDYIVHFTKPRDVAQAPSDSSQEMFTKAGIERDVIDVIKHILIAKGEPMTFTDLINETDTVLSKHAWFLYHDIRIKDIMKRHPGTFVQVKETIGPRTGSTWSLPDMKPGNLPRRGNSSKKMHPS